MRFDVLGKFDVIIIGSGISGLLCALELAKNKKSVCILTKEAVTEGASLYAQGGIAVPFSNNDSIEKHLEDTLKAGCGLGDYNVAKEIISKSIAAFEKLVSYGIVFDSDKEGKVHQTREAAHSVPRVCHVGQDASGRFITKVLIDKACRDKEGNISISQGSVVLNILKNDDNEACGVLASDVTKNNYVLLANDIIVATGGIGQLYKQTTNPQVCTGDGVVMSYRCGAYLQDIEMIQFHPTVLLEYGDPFLITEAIRGEGAKLKNINGEYFASKYHKSAELAPRDILARAILKEMEITNSRNVYLDLSDIDYEYFKVRFPNIYKTCLERKVDLFNKGIPVSPAQHYFIGGVKSDVYGRTSIPHLWVIGEASSNGFHGANRLASNSLLECIVVPGILIEKLLSVDKTRKKSNSFEFDIDIKEYDENEVLSIRTEMQKMNSLALGLFRSSSNLNEHSNWLNNLLVKFNYDKLSLNHHVQELKNMLLLSDLTCQAANLRKHSLGAHFREDFPQNPETPEHSIIKPDTKIINDLTFSK